jgi:hypothetical protein
VRTHRPCYGHNRCDVFRCVNHHFRRLLLLDDVDVAGFHALGGHACGKGLWLPIQKGQRSGNTVLSFGYREVGAYNAISNGSKRTVGLLCSHFAMLKQDTAMQRCLTCAHRLLSHVRRAVHTPHSLSSATRSSHFGLLSRVDRAQHATHTPFFLATRAASQDGSCR